MSTQIDALRADLDAAGWHFGPAMKDTGVAWYAWRRLENAADCASNDKPPSFVLNPYEININGETHNSAEFVVTGAVVGDHWLQLKAYSVKIDDVMVTIPRAEELLKTAWNAAAAITEQKEGGGK